MPDARRDPPSYLADPKAKVLPASWLTVALVLTGALGAAWLLFRWLVILIGGQGIEPPVE